MPEKLSKMQQRYELLSVLNKYRTLKEPKAADVSADIDALLKLENKDYIAKVLFQEIISAQGDFENICAIFALEVLDVDTFEKHAIEFLQKHDIPDKKKFLVISLVKQKGINFNYDDISNYLESPESYAKKSIKDFLSNIIQDPEVKIDLLDFYINVQPYEKNSLLSNLAEELDDSVIEAFSLIAQLEGNRAEEFDIIYDVLMHSNSPHALDGLKHILKYSEFDFKIKRTIKKKIDEIEEQNRDFKNDAIVKDSKPLDAFISFVDGNSNFSLGFARERSKGSIDCIFLTISIPHGLTSCMGFGNINFTNYDTLKKRLFTDSIPVKINPMIIKSIIEHYVNKNKKTKTPIPYEYIVWSKLFTDIKTINYDLSQYINTKLDTINLTYPKVKKFVGSKVLDTWYWLAGQNKYVDEIIKMIEKEHLIELEFLDKVIEEKISNNFLQDEAFKQELTDKLFLQAYIASQARLKMSSMTAYSLCFKNDYTNLLISSMIYRSIYHYFESFLPQNNKTRNIFAKEKKTTLSYDEIELLMSQIEDKWS